MGGGRAIGPADATLRNIVEEVAIASGVPVPAAFMDAAVRTTRRVPARTWQQLMRGMLATGPATGLGRHRIPTLLIWGDRDATFGREEQEALLALLPGARLTVYEATGHAPHWERPARFASGVNRFLAGG